MSIPSTNDLQVLKEYQFKDTNDYELEPYNYPNNSAILGLKKENGSMRLVIIQKSDVTYLNLFLRIFNCGTLAHTSLCLDTICGHLLMFDWKQYERPDSSQHESYKKVCQIAGRAMVYHRLIYGRTFWGFTNWNRDVIDLFHKVSKPTLTAHGLLYLNPALTARELLVQMVLKLENIHRPMLTICFRDFLASYRPYIQKNSLILPSEIVDTTEKVNRICFANKITSEEIIVIRSPSHNLETALSVIQYANGGYRVVSTDHIYRRNRQ